MSITWFNSIKACKLSPCLRKNPDLMDNITKLTYHYGAQPDRSQVGALLFVFQDVS